ncbi:MAG: sugar ABC transporter substrate-binding protein [Anaerolineae bacterium]
MSKKVFLIGLLVVVLASLSLSAVIAQDQPTLTWRTRPDNQAEIDVYTAINEQVQALMPGVTLEYQAGGTETAGYQDTLLTEFAAGNAPDVFWIPGTDIARFAKAGAILNLADIAAADANFDVNVFYPQQVQELSHDGALWGLPRDASAFALYYNKDLFDEAGIPYPTEQLANGDWTWDSFAESAAAISDLGDEIYGFGMNAWWANPGLFINSAGASFFNEDKTACNLNNQETIDALNFMRSLYANESAVPYGTDSEPPFLAGNVGMFLNGRWATPNMLAQADFNWDVAEVPVGPAGQSNWLFWGAYVVNANTANPEAAWELVKNLTSTDVQAQVTALGANIPSRMGEDAVAAFLASTPEIDSAVFTNALANYAVPEAPLWTGDWSQIDAAYGAGFTEVLNGTMTAEDFSASICDEVAQYFNS